MIARRTALFVVGLTLVVAAVAQRPLNPANYYAFQLPLLEPGAVLSGELALTDGQNFKDGSYLDLFAFQGQVDEFVTILVSSGEFDPFVSVFSPSGELLMYNDDYNFAAGTDAGVDLWLPETGRYVVVVSGLSQYDLGRYVIERKQTQSVAGVEAQTLPVPGDFESVITSDLPLLAGGFGGNTEHFSFEIASPTFLVISMSSWEIDTLLTIYDSSGQVVTQNDDYDFGTDSRIAVELQPGSYVLAASSYYPGAGGTYSLQVKRYVESD